MINNYSNKISFGQVVSTPLLLKAGCEKISFDDAKMLNSKLGVKYSGYIGFVPRAVDFAKKVAKNNAELAKIFEELKNIPKEQLSFEIKKYVYELGEKIDIII